LVKIDLSSNKFKQSFSLYAAFSLASKLIEINLNANGITYIDIDFSGISSNSTSAMTNSVAATELVQDQRKSMNDDDKVKRIGTPKNRLLNLKVLNLSNNDMILTRGGFTKLLCNIYKLAPNLKAFYYDQQNGSKLGPLILSPEQKVLTVKRLNSTNVLSNSRTNPKQPPTTTTTAASATDSHQGDLVALVDEDYYFDYDGNEVDENTFVSPLSAGPTTGQPLPLPTTQLKNEAYSNMLTNLEVIDLSFNNLKKIPGLIYEMKNLKEIYFNGNLLKKIPNELYTKPASPEDQANFERLKELQQIKIDEDLRAERRKNNEDFDEDDEDEYEEEEMKKKNKKKKRRNPPTNSPKLRRSVSSSRRHHPL
jgi:hypothetical protein